MRCQLFNLLLVLAGISSLLSISRADEGLRAVQEALKSEQFYFGAPTGKLDYETRNALRRFQIHSGLPITGAADEATLRALQTSAASGDASEPSTGRGGSVRDQSRDLMQDDREFLKNLEGTSDDASARQNEADSQLPPQVAPSQRIEPPQAEIAPPVRNRHAPVASDNERQGGFIRKTPSSRNDERTPSPEEVQVTDRYASEFVRAYLDAAEEATPNSEVSFYADTVHYFTSGKVERAFIAKDQRNYYKRWPNRKFALLGEPQILQQTSNGAVVRFRIAYQLSGGGEVASGKVENIIRMRMMEDGPKITSIQERKLNAR